MTEYKNRSWRSERSRKILVVLNVQHIGGYWFYYIVIYVLGDSLAAGKSTQKKEKWIKKKKNHTLCQFLHRAIGNELNENAISVFEPYFSSAILLSMVLWNLKREVTRTGWFNSAAHTIKVNSRLPGPRVCYWDCRAFTLTKLLLLTNSTCRDTNTHSTLIPILMLILANKS